MPLPEKRLQEINLESIFEKKEVLNPGFFEKLFQTKEKEIELSEEDKKVLFLLENNLLVNIAKLQESGYKLNENHTKDYHKRLYESILKDSEQTLRDYLKNNLEMPTKFLAMGFLMEMQERKSVTWMNLNKTVTSFLDKVKKGLDKDPVARYKFHKLNDKEFINELFDIWYELGTKHINDLENNVTNKVNFLFFKVNKSGTKLQKDLDNFINNTLQKHIYHPEDFYSIPFKSTHFTDHVSMDKMLKCKELIKRHEAVNKKLSEFRFLRESDSARVLDTKQVSKIIELIESKVREHYQEEQMELVEDIQSVSNQNYLQKVVTRKMIKGIDDNLMNKLPKEALEKIDEIRKISSALYEKQLNDETKEIVGFLWQDKLPEIIKKYLNIDNQYRENLKNVQGKNAKELMIESLSIIQESLKHIEKDINEENLKNLSIHTRYIKNKFKN